jgi:hypothetical protein
MRQKRKSNLNKSKMITVRVPQNLLDKMSRYRRLEGVSVTFQMCKGAELFLRAKNAWETTEEVK